MDAPALQVYCGNAATDVLPVRGVAWVLRWAAALLVFAFSALMLTSFAYQIAAERALRQAAAAGLREAALPRATTESVKAAVRRSVRIQNYRLRPLQVQLDRGGVPMRGVIGAANGEPLTLKLTAAAADLSPHWLSFSGGEIAVTVRSIAAH